MTDLIEALTDAVLECERRYQGQGACLRSQVAQTIKNVLREQGVYCQICGRLLSKWPDGEDKQSEPRNKQ